MHNQIQSVAGAAIAAEETTVAPLIVKAKSVLSSTSRARSMSVYEASSGYTEGSKDLFPSSLGCLLDLVSAWCFTMGEQIFSGPREQTGA